MTKKRLVYVMYKKNKNDKNNDNNSTWKMDIAGKWKCKKYC